MLAVLPSALAQVAAQAAAKGAQPPSNAPVNPVAPPRIPQGAPSDTKPSTPLQTLADTLVSTLGPGAVGSPTDNIGPAVITETAVPSSGGTVDLKKIAILAGIALGAWFLWKKYGKKAAS